MPPSRRAHLVEAAARLFEQQGFHATGIDYESRGREFESSRARHYFNGLAEVTAKVSHSIPEKLVTPRSCPVLRVAGGAVHFGDCKLRSAPLFAVLPDHFGCAVSRN